MTTRDQLLAEARLLAFDLTVERTERHGRPTIEVRYTQAGMPILKTVTLMPNDTMTEDQAEVWLLGRAIDELRAA